MKKFLLGYRCARRVGMAAPASAADLAARPYKAAPIAVPLMYDWIGLLHRRERRLGSEQQLPEFR